MPVVHTSSAFNKISLILSKGSLLYEYNMSVFDFTPLMGVHF